MSVREKDACRINYNYLLLMRKIRWKDAAGTSLDGNADSAQRVCSNKKTLAHYIYNMINCKGLQHMFDGLSTACLHLTNSNSRK